MNPAGPQSAGPQPEGSPRRRAAAPSVPSVPAAAALPRNPSPARMAPHPHHPNLRLFEHPLVSHKLARLRDRATLPDEFRRLLGQVAGLMALGLLEDLPLAEVAIDTPLERTTGTRLRDPLTLVPILRAGLGMAEGLLAVLPEARVGHLGLFRDERSLSPVEYYAHLPADVAAGPVLVVDPMVATGGSASAAITHLKRLGCRAIRLACLVAAPVGVERLAREHPDVPLYAAALDRELDARGYILPGLGDAGDRSFGTT